MPMRVNIHARSGRARRTTNHNDPFELVRADESILIIVEVLERLAEAFALQALHKLGKLVICITA